MTTKTKPTVVAGIIVLFVGVVFGIAGPRRPDGGAHKEDRLNQRATGTFEVKLKPQDDKGPEGLGRMTIEKQLHGDFEGSSSGQMLTAMTKVEGSAVYVAVERLTGTLQGRQGSFALHHTGIMNRGAQQLNIKVVPDSGTDQLTGITGTMTIKIADGKHFYDLDYTLPGQQ